MSYKIEMMVTGIIFMCLLFSIGTYASTPSNVSVEDNPEISILKEKPTIVLSDLRIVSISNSWGEVSLDTTTVNTEILVNEPDLSLIPLKVNCDIYLNDIRVVSGMGKDLRITKCASGSLVRFSSRIENEKIIKWWVSHIKNKEKTKVRIEGKLVIPLEKVDIIYPFCRESEFETNILKGLNKRNLATIRPLNYRIQTLESRWGNVTLSTTEIKHKITIKNIGIWIAQPISDIEYIFVCNGIQMTKGKVGLPLVILPGQKRSAKFTLRIPNKNIIKWWVSHLQNGEKTKYCFHYRFWVLKPLGKSKWQKTCGSFESNIFPGARIPKQLEVKKSTTPVKMKVTVRLKSAKLIYNNHVGNDWSIYSEVNGHLITRHQKFEKIYDGPEATLEIFAFAKENDKYPDIGLASQTLNLRLKDKAKDTQIVTLDVQVVEDRGRYAGNSALWRFTYEVSVEPEKPGKEEK